ncbi:pseudouridine synthase [Mahella australiensis]|uniref:pseudouridine synthase n=1 Tax=Mahella australiensis TaxID=252966 RepID=UPI0005A01FE9|nr:pseudouridine synthase [Mahella australiensis]
MIRLHKYMAQCGVASRRKSEELIKSGAVSVNGHVVKDMGILIDPQKDEVRVYGRIIRLKSDMIYIAVNKPRGYVSTVKDQFGRPTVLDLVPVADEYRLYPVGRLDYDTTGLILLTNDGDLTYRLTHPKHEIEKIYVAGLRGIPDNQDIFRFEHGLVLEGRLTAPAGFELIKADQRLSVVKITLREGRNRQIRKMCDMIGHPVIWLRREAIGEVELCGLQPGQWRYLTPKEIEYLKYLR